MGVLDVTIADHVATVTLNRPEARNALNPELIIALAEAWDRLAADDEVRVIVVAAAEGTTFCRGTQTADDAGIVEFATIYPGWYPGRTPHIHVRIWVDGSPVKVGQLYFPDDYSAQIYAGGAYAEFGGADTTNATDGLTQDIEADGSLLTLAAGTTRSGEGTVALTNLGIG